MAKYNNVSIGFDTFDRGIDYDGAIYACNCSVDALSCDSAQALSTTTMSANNSWCDTVADCSYTISDKYDHLQNEIDMLKEQLSKVGYSAKNAGAALKSVFNRLSNTKVSLRNQLQTITEWQTI
ncbi:MAG: hypothetical protein IJZ62_05885 [Clostridia bacterium]|nr:hypothetical protein [Clostridia bacterium]